MPQRRSPRAAPPRLRACAASAPCSGSINVVGHVAERRPTVKGEGGPSRRRPPPSNDHKRLLRLLAVGLMTTTAILAHLGDLNLEAVEVLGCIPGRLGL